ncbi:MAG: hypothetical protein IIY06_06660 [Proteobacteria bacterium]|nr:hypothetical protein [Pseudomonadota bacterium]
MLIRKRRFFEESLYKHSVNEMANMGTTRGGITIKVHSGEGSVPHLHFTIDENHQGCLSLAQAEYFTHGQYTATLNAHQLKDVIRFLGSSAASHGFNPGWSKYVDCCSEWNKNNPQYAMTRQEMPDYSIIND